SREDEKRAVGVFGGFLSGFFSRPGVGGGPRRPFSRRRRARGPRTPHPPEGGRRVGDRERAPGVWGWGGSDCLTSASTRARVSHGGFGSRPEKNMLYSASSCLRSASSRVRSRSRVDGGTSAHRISSHTSGSQSSRAYGTGRSSMSTSVSSETPT